MAKAGSEGDEGMADNRKEKHDPTAAYLRYFEGRYTVTESQRDDKEGAEAGKREHAKKGGSKSSGNGKGKH
jgi:hypothetical protein